MGLLPTPGFLRPRHPEPAPADPDAAARGAGARRLELGLRGWGPGRGRRAANLQIGLGSVGVRGTGGLGEPGRGAGTAERRSRAAVPTAAAQPLSSTARELAFGREHRLPGRGTWSLNPPNPNRPHSLGPRHRPGAAPFPARGGAGARLRSEGLGRGSPTGSRAGLGRLWAGRRDAVGIGGPPSWSAHRDLGVWRRVGGPW